MSLIKHSVGDWRLYLNSHRSGVTSCINTIRSGIIDESELDKLSNFCQIALSLMSRSGSLEWQRSQRDAELADYLKQLPEPP